mmetsp:Transcript_517/g.2122  ORF Transcript_517/g.2122 Transcript_517/m.2122 type:complete len:379 (-) Transcript_517:67-1203(-)
MPRRIHECAGTSCGILNPLFLSASSLMPSTTDGNTMSPPPCRSRRLARYAIGSPKRSASRIAASARASMSDRANGFVDSSARAARPSAICFACATPVAHIGLSRSLGCLAASFAASRAATSSAVRIRPVALSRTAVAAKRPDASSPSLSIRALAAARFSSASRTTVAASTKPVAVPSVMVGARLRGGERSSFDGDLARRRGGERSGDGDRAPPRRGGERSPAASSSLSCLRRLGGERSASSSSLSCRPGLGGERSSSPFASSSPSPSATAHPDPSSLMPRYCLARPLLTPGSSPPTTTGPSSSRARRSASRSAAYFQSSTSSSWTVMPVPSFLALGAAPSDPPPEGAPSLSFLRLRFFFFSPSPAPSPPASPPRYRRR